MVSALRIVNGTVHDPANGVDGEGPRNPRRRTGKIVKSGPFVPGRREASSTPAAWWSCPAVSISTATSPAPRSTWRGKAPCPRTTASIVHPAHGVQTRSGHRGHRALDVRHRLPLCDPGLHVRHGSRRHPRSAPATPWKSFTTPRSSTRASIVLLGNNVFLLPACSRRGVTGGVPRRRGLVAQRQQGLHGRSWSTRAATSRGRGKKQRQCHHGPGREPSPVFEVSRRAGSLEALVIDAAERPAPAPSGAHPLQQPGSQRKRRDHAGDHENATEGPPRPYRPRPVSQLWRRGGRRRQGGRQPHLGSAPEIVEYINTHPNISCRRGPGDVRPVDGDDRRRAAGVSCCSRFKQGQTVGQRRYGMRERLRHHARSPTRSTSIPTPCSGRSGWSCCCCRRIPWRIVFSTDHPNGGSFMSYPQA